MAVCAVLVAADLLTKHFEEADGWFLVIIPGWIQLVGGVRNQGCAFSFLNDKPEIGQPVLITLTCLMLVFLVLLFIFLQDKNIVLKIAVSVVIAGAVGNLVDRFMLREVRDFIGLNMLFNGNLVYCNLADFYIVIGAILAVIDLLFLNEWAVFPLTKRAKEAQAKRREADLAEGTKTDVLPKETTEVTPEEKSEETKEEITEQQEETVAEETEKTDGDV